MSDLASLFQFLRPYPYDDATTFEAHIIEPWKRGNEEIAIQRLKRLFTAIALRRSKTVVELPTRLNIRRTLEFTPAELTQYRESEVSIVTILDDAIRSGQYTPGLYANALQRINRLRMICNLGTFVNASKDERDTFIPEDQWTSSIAQGYLNNLVTVGITKCAECGVDFESLSQTENDQSPETNCEGKLFKCMVLLCSQCFQNRSKKRSSRCFSCGSSPPCPSAGVSASCSFSVPAQCAPQESKHSIEFPTKVRALVEDVLKLPRNTKR